MNLYNDKEFQDGIFSCADLIKDYFECQPPILANYKKGVDFSITLLQSVYDSLAEEKPYVNPSECDCQGCKRPESVTTTTGEEYKYFSLEIEPDDKPIIINSPRYSLDYEGAEY